MADWDTSNPPPIPVRSHHNIGTKSQRQRDSRRRRSLPSSSGAGRAPTGPAKPEVISDLISSLTSVPSPTAAHFDASLTGSSASVPPSPGATGASGSFGVDYGAFHQPSLEDIKQDSASLNELPATSPIVRTSRPPSGLSPLTAPKSPTTPRSTSRDSTGLRSFIRSSTASRPSSKGSLGSKNDDTHSIGGISVERGSVPEAELSRRRSIDSWGKKNRSSKGLLYMTSKERLREKDLERKRTSAMSLASVGESTLLNGSIKRSSSQHSVQPADTMLAEMAISEEPLAGMEVLREATQSHGMDTGRPVPPRDSSLRNSNISVSKRTSSLYYQKDSEAVLAASIPEVDQLSRGRDVDKSKSSRSQQHSTKSRSPHVAATAVEQLAKQRATPKEQSRPIITATPSTEILSDVDEYESAPFPAVMQGRRRDESFDRGSRRMSGALSPGPAESINSKRDGKGGKRNSALSSPRKHNRRNASFDYAPTLDPAPIERPGSADSVDDAVESYLKAPRLTQTIEHPQTGRLISFSEVGDPEGSAVFCCVGMGLTRYIMAFYDELALTLKLRLITPDRPGIGKSEPYTDGTTTPLSWPDDVYTICQHLRITKFSILAHSAGAIYALATALRMPQHIRGRIHLLAPWIPPSQMSVFGSSQALPPTKAIPTSQRVLRALPTPILKAVNSSFMTATSSSVTSSLPKNPKRTKRKSSTTMREGPALNGANRNITPSLDKENLNGFSVKNGRPHTSDGQTRPDNISLCMGPPKGSDINDEDAQVLAAAAEAVADKERQSTYDIRLTHAIWALATTGANPAVDLLVCLERQHTIGFRYVDITRPVVIHHGSRDNRVPVENIKWLGKAMRRCEVRVLENEGHGLMASASVMGSVLMEMSKEWDDWLKVTSSEGRKDRERGRRPTAAGR